jgi:hypothetical protein
VVKEVAKHAPKSPKGDLAVHSANLFVDDLFFRRDNRLIASGENEGCSQNLEEVQYKLG